MKKYILLLLAFISLGCYGQTIELGSTYIKYDNIDYNGRNLNHLEFVDSILKANLKIAYVNFYQCGLFVKSIKANKFTTDRHKMFLLINRESLWQQLKPSKQHIAMYNYMNNLSDEKVIVTDHGTVYVDQIGSSGSYVVKDKSGKVIDSGSFTSY